LVPTKIRPPEVAVKNFFAPGEKKLRIVELINVRWWNACAEYGFNLALGLHRRGHRVIVVGLPGSPVLRKARQVGLPWRAMEMNSRHPGKLLGSLMALVSLIRRQGIQVIDAHRAEAHLFAALASLSLSRRVVVIRTRGDVRLPKNHLLNKFLHRHLTDALVLPAEVMRSPVSERLGKFPDDKMWVIPPGVDLRKFSKHTSPEKGRRALGWPEKEPVVGIVGRLSPVKGHRVFLEAARLVLRVKPGVAFVIVGQDAQMKSTDLKGLVERLGLAQRVRLVGFVSEVSSLIGAFDVAVVASTGSEVICRVALEHMAMARPVVGTQVNAIPEVVAHGSTGLLVPPGDAQAMSEAILSLLQDPQKARVFGNAGRKRVVERFTLDHQACRTERLYRRLLEDR